MPHFPVEPTPDFIDSGYWHVRTLPYIGRTGRVKGSRISPLVQAKVGNGVWRGPTSAIMVSVYLQCRLPAA